MKINGNSDIGIVRKINEDSINIEMISSDFSIALVADGMGGHSEGKKAGEIASETIMEYLKSQLTQRRNLKKNEIRKALENAVSKANSQIYELSNSDEKYAGMGTTVVVCIVYKENYYIVNVGDSRLYAYGDSLIQITKDHSFVRELVDLGLISEQQAKSHPNKNVLTRALGTDEKIESDFYSGEFTKLKKILMCSDGLTNMISDEEIEQILSSGETVENTVEKLIEKAKNNGGKDNISVVVIVNDKKVV